MGYRIPKLQATSHTIFLIILSIFILALSYSSHYVSQIWALNKVNNWDFNGNSTGWTVTNGTGTDVCGGSGSTVETSMESFAYDGTTGNSAGSFKAQLNTTSNNQNRRGKITQTFVAPGSGTVKAKGRFDYYTSGVSWSGTANSSWVRLDIYDSGDSTYVGNLACVSFNSNQNWTTASFGSDLSLTGGTTYTIRVTIRNRNATTDGANSIWIDNIIVNVAPTGFSASSVTDSTNISLSWTASTAGTGANTLNSSTPYKVYRKASAGVTVSDFLANATTNSYTDSSTTGNTTYYYAVTDYDTANVESPLSAESNILTRPGVPSSLSFSNVLPYSQRINWSAPIGGASSYKIEQCQGTSCNSYSELATGVMNTYYDAISLNANTTYRYRIKATNTSGDGAYSTAAENATSAVVVSVTITSDGTLAYGSVAANTTKNTTAGDLNDTQTARNDGNVTETFNIKTSNATGGTGWNLGSDAGVNTFVHYFSTNGGGAWTKFTTADSYQTLITGKTVNATQNFDLQIITPTSSSDGSQKNITITIQAVQE